MCPGESTGRSAGQGGPDDLASAILARIIGGDLPGGAELAPTRLAAVFSAADADIVAALRLLETHGAAVPDGANWRVADSLDRDGRALLLWVLPLLRAVVLLASARVTPAEAAGILAAYDRYVGLAGEATAESRLNGYRLMMTRLAAASGSAFHAASLAAILESAGPHLARMVAHQMASRRVAEPDDELGRLAQALMQGNVPAASAALEDHLLLLSRYLDCPAPTAP